MTQHFTKQQIDEIERALTSRSRKDTEFQRSENIDGTELLPIVKDGMNKVTPYSELWNKVEQDVDLHIHDELETKVDKIPGKGLSTNDYTNNEKSKLGSLPTRDEYDAALGGKVDKIEGKGLSKNDFTDFLYNKLMALPTNEELALTLLNYYLKTETYSKSEVNELVESIKQFSYVIVQSLPTASAETMNIIYLVPSPNPESFNVKDEYITIRSGNSPSYTYYWEQIGSTEIDLSGYVQYEETQDPSNPSLINEYTRVLSSLYQALNDAMIATTNAKADYVGEDNYVYHWDGAEGRYLKTNIYVKGGPGTTNYDELINKPIIPDQLSDLQDDDRHRTVSDVEKEIWSAKGSYSKPFDGIPKSDLASGVQSSLDKADAAAPQATTYTKTEVDNKIDIINAKIPAQASPSNKLADKDFVNSSISTATATHRGTYNLVTELFLSTSATQSEISEAIASKLASLFVIPDNNDYVFVQIPTSDAKPTEIARVDRYKYNGTAWAFEYSINNSGFTAAQWAAINSGITSALVAAFNAKYDKPSGGIPNSDLAGDIAKNKLASDVQTSLSKADTAVQYVESNSLQAFFSNSN